METYDGFNATSLLRQKGHTSPIIAMTQRRLGRLQEHYWRASAACEVKIAKREQPRSEPAKR